MITILIIFLVIFISGKYLKGQIYVDNLSKQPINNIRRLEIIDNNDDNDDKDDDNDNIFVYTEDKT